MNWSVTYLHIFSQTLIIVFFGYGVGHQRIDDDVTYYW